VRNRSLNALLENCTQCGLCREVCTVERMGAHSVTSFLSGEKEYSSWLCSSCWRCQEVCPEGVDIHAIMMANRREEMPPAGHEANFRTVLQWGYALPIGEGLNELRRMHGLEAVKPIPLQWLEILLGGQDD
jgi:heterodisulfide reductase subunit C